MEKTAKLFERNAFLWRRPWLKKFSAKSKSVFDYTRSEISTSIFQHSHINKYDAIQRISASKSLTARYTQALRLLISLWNLTVPQKRTFPCERVVFHVFAYHPFLFIYGIIQKFFFRFVFAPFEFIAHARFLLCQINKPIARKYKTGAHKINRTRSSNTILRNCIMLRLINNWRDALVGLTFEFIGFWRFLRSKVCFDRWLLLWLNWTVFLFDVLKSDRFRVCSWFFF